MPEGLPENVPTLNGQKEGFDTVPPLMRTLALSIDLGLRMNRFNIGNLESHQIDTLRNGIRKLADTVSESNPVTLEDIVSLDFLLYDLQKDNSDMRIGHLKKLLEKNLNKKGIRPWDGNLQ